MTPLELKNITTEICDENIAFVKKKVSKLSSTQLDWIPNPGVWSVRQTLAHINISSEHYLNNFTRKIDTTRFTSTVDNFISSPLGRSAWKSMKLGRAKNIKRKFKSPKTFNPVLIEKREEDEVELFLQNNEQLKQVTEKALTVNLRKVKIPTALSKIVRLRLGDALLFVIYHNQRHIQQVANLIQHKNFPKK